VKENNGLPLLAHAFQWILWANVGSPQIFPELIEILLDHGADPNEVVGGATVWQHVLNYVHSAFDRWIPGLEQECLQWHAAFKIMLEHSADPRACCMDYCPAWDSQSHSRQFSQSLQAQTTLLLPVFMQSEKVRSEHHCAYHSVSAVVDAAFGERFPAGATELLRMVNNPVNGDENSASKILTKRKAWHRSTKLTKKRRI
jgi:hypothetical protein